MSVNDSLFWIFSDLLALTPFILLLRAAFPQASAFRTVLTLVGVYSLYLIGPRFVLFFVFYWIIIWALQSLLSISLRSNRDFVKKGLTSVVIVIALLPMAVWKIVPQVFEVETNKFFTQLLWGLLPGLGPSDAMFGMLVPLGLSFAVFRALDLLIKVRLELLEPVGLGRVFYYGFFPPILALGPISEYEEVRCETTQARWPIPGDLAIGAFRVGLGSIKIFLASHYLESTATALWASGNTSWWMLWLAVAAFGLHFYVNFSGYSDLAIGIARLWGIRLKENFNNPYLKTNPQAFWANWHMSLTRWAQRYVFIPLGGMRRNRQYFAVFMTIMVIALWHGLEWSLVFFGIYHATIVTGHRWLEEYQRNRGAKKSESPLVNGLKSLLVFTYVALSIPLFYLPISEVPGFYRSLLPF